MYLNKISKQQKNKKAKRKEKNPFAFDLEHLSQFSEWDKNNRDSRGNNHDSSRFRSTRSSDVNRFNTVRGEENWLNDLSPKFSSKAKKLFNNRNSYPKINAKQILKIVSTLLLILSANEVLAGFDFDKGITAGVKPLHDVITKWWPFGIGIPAAIGAMIGEGDLRVRGKNTMIGAAIGTGAVLFLLGAMGPVAGTPPT